MTCYELKQGSVAPSDDWLCARCQPRPVNVNWAKHYQTQYLAVVSGAKDARRRNGEGATAAAARGAKDEPAEKGKKRGRRNNAKPASQAGAPPAPNASAGVINSGGRSTATAYENGGVGGEKEGTVPPGASTTDNFLDVEDDWRGTYVPLDVDRIPDASTRAKLAYSTQNWRGLTALSLTPPGSPSSRVLCVEGAKDRDTAVRPARYGLHTTKPISEDALISPFTSTIVPSASYLADPLNAYTHLGMPKPHVHLVPPPLSVALDARAAGNEARFIRSGCHPNAVLRPVLCSKSKGKKKATKRPHLRSEDAEEGEEVSEQYDATLRFAVYALRDLKASEEVVLGWEWDDGAVVHHLPALIAEGVRGGPSKLTPHYMERLRLQMRLILDGLQQNFVSCACGAAAKDCALRLMESFADGRPFPPDIWPPADNEDDDAADADADAEQQELINKHPGSLKELQEIGRRKYQKEKAARAGKRAASKLPHYHAQNGNENQTMPGGPLIGAERGVKVALVGGANSGNLSGARNTKGDTWDQFGILEEEGEERGMRGRSVPEVRVEDASPMKDVRGRMSGREVNGDGGGRRTMVGLGLGLGLGLTPPPVTSSRGATPTSISTSQEINSAPVKEAQMPPKMRKRWIAEKRADSRKVVEQSQERSAKETAVGMEPLVTDVSTNSDQEVEQQISPVAPRSRRETVPVQMEDTAMDVDAQDKSKSKSASPSVVVAPNSNLKEFDKSSMPPPSRVPTPSSSVHAQAFPQPPPQPISKPHLTPIATELSPSTSTPVSSSSRPSTVPTTAPARRSLFSLLNDTSVSPISSKKELAPVSTTIVQAPVPVPVHTPLVPRMPSASAPSEMTPTLVVDSRTSSNPVAVAVKGKEAEAVRDFTSSVPSFVAPRSEADNATSPASKSPVDISDPHKISTISTREPTPQPQPQPQLDPQREPSLPPQRELTTQYHLRSPNENHSPLQPESEAQPAAVESIPAPLPKLQKPRPKLRRKSNAQPLNSLPTPVTPAPNSLRVRVGKGKVDEWVLGENESEAEDKYDVSSGSGTPGETMRGEMNVGSKDAAAGGVVVNGIGPVESFPEPTREVMEVEDVVMADPEPEPEPEPVKEKTPEKIEEKVEEKEMEEKIQSRAASMSAVSELTRPSTRPSDSPALNGTSPLSDIDSERQESDTPPRHRHGSSESDSINSPRDQQHRHTSCSSLSEAGSWASPPPANAHEDQDQQDQKALSPVSSISGDFVRQGDDKRERVEAQIRVQTQRQSSKSRTQSRTPPPWAPSPPPPAPASPQTAAEASSATVVASQIESPLMLFKEELMEHARLLKGDNALQLQDDDDTGAQSEHQEQEQALERERERERSPLEHVDAMDVDVELTKEVAHSSNRGSRSRSSSPQMLMEGLEDTRMKSPTPASSTREDEKVNEDASKSPPRAEPPASPIVSNGPAPAPSALQLNVGRAPSRSPMLTPIMTTLPVPGKIIVNGIEGGRSRSTSHTGSEIDAGKRTTPAPKSTPATASPVTEKANSPSPREVTHSPVSPVVLISSTAPSPASAAQAVSVPSKPTAIAGMPGSARSASLPLSETVAPPSESTLAPASSETHETEAASPMTATTSLAPPEPAKVRRSMADYRQRKKKEREEAAKAASFASPATPTLSVPGTFGEANVAEKATTPVVDAKAVKEAEDARGERTEEKVIANIHRSQEAPSTPKAAPASSLSHANLKTNGSPAMENLNQLLAVASKAIPSLGRNQASTSPVVNGSAIPGLRLSNSPEILGKNLPPLKAENEVSRTVPSPLNTPRILPVSNPVPPRPATPQGEEDGEITSTHSPSPKVRRGSVSHAEYTTSYHPNPRPVLSSQSMSPNIPQRDRAPSGTRSPYPEDYESRLYDHQRRLSKDDIFAKGPRATQRSISPAPPIAPLGPKAMFGAPRPQPSKLALGESMKPENIAPERRREISSSVHVPISPIPMAHSESSPSHSPSLIQRMGPSSATLPPSSVRTHPPPSGPRALRAPALASAGIGSASGGAGAGPFSPGGSVGSASSLRRGSGPVGGMDRDDYDRERERVRARDRELDRKMGREGREGREVDREIWDVREIRDGRERDIRTHSPPPPRGRIPSGRGRGWRGRR